MFDIFKWFFGIVLVIIFAYAVVVGVRAVLSATTDSVPDPSSATSTASTSSTMRNWFANLYKPSAYSYVPGTVIVAGKNSESVNSNSNVQYRNPLADKILNSYSKWDLTGNREEDDFDARWGGGLQNQNEQINSEPNSTNKQISQDYSTSNSKIKSNIDENSFISNNQVLTGYADLSIFANRSFTIEILDQNKKSIGAIKAYVNGDIQKNGTVPFRGVLSFNTPDTAGGYLKFDGDILMKIYFSSIRTGLVSSRLPTMLFSSPVDRVGGGCVVSGCNMQFCVEQNEVMNLVSSCQYLKAYDCYRQAVCERNQQTGRCGWKIDNSLAACLQSNY